MMDSRLWYSALMVLVAFERLVELGLSRRNVARTIAAGGVEHGASHYPLMVTLHCLFLAACLLEVWLLDRRFSPALGVPMLILSVLAMGLRYWAIASLGSRWTTRVVVVPGRRPVTSGPYCALRHPNYLAVAVEMLALPLVHSAWLTASVFTVLNAALLRTRIRVEEAALSMVPEAGK